MVELADNSVAMARPAIPDEQHLGHLKWSALRGGLRLGEEFEFIDQGGKGGFTRIDGDNHADV